MKVIVNHIAAMLHHLAASPEIRQPLLGYESRFPGLALRNAIRVGVFTESL